MYKSHRPLTNIFLVPGGRADCPAAGSTVALWEVPGCAGASAKLAERHRRAGG